MTSAKPSCCVPSRRPQVSLHCESGYQQVPKRAFGGINSWVYRNWYLELAKGHRAQPAGLNNRSFQILDHLLELGPSTGAE